jgi:CRISPR-associated helicase Cas3/CRISPR-associated endonuclease Cas3-HD
MTTATIEQPRLQEWAHSPNETGKPEPLIDHLECVATLCERFAAKFGAGNWGRIAGLWHDLGKYSREFQAYIRGLVPGPIDHSTAGAQHAYQQLGAAGQLLAYVITGHHGGMLDYYGSRSLTTRMSEDYTRNRIRDWHPYAPADLLRLQLAEPLPITLSDDALFQISFFTRMLFSALVDADFLATESFLDRKKSQKRKEGASIDALAATLEKHLSDLQAEAEDTPVNRQRRAILAHCVAASTKPPGLFSLTVPTGGGKTLASLIFALKHAKEHGMDRAIVVVPYISIIEQTAKIYRDVFKAFPGAVIEHHSIYEHERKSTDDSPTQHISIRLATENWDATIVVTTAVQFYDSLFANKPSKCRKLHRIARSVIILDEAQTLPVGLLAPCLSALRALPKYGSSVVLCTATQPALGKRPDFAPGLSDVHEIIPDPAAFYESMRRVKVDFVGAMSDPELLIHLADHAQALCIVNTTKHAARLATALSDLPGTYHLSARMCPVHRLGLIDEIKARLQAGKPCRVISTQVIEAGVDVDFPIVYRALCGLDSLAQAAGRCNREGLLECGEVIFFLSDDPPINALRAAADACLQVLPDHIDDLLSPAAIEAFFHQYYWSRGDYDTKKILPLLTAGAHNLEFQFASAAQFAMIDSPTQAVVIPWLEEGVELCAQLRQPDLLDHAWLVAKLSRRAQRYSVNVWPNEFEQLKDSGRIELVHDEWWLLRERADYSPVTGLIRQDASGDVMNEIG